MSVPDDKTMALADAVAEWWGKNRDRRQAMPAPSRFDESAPLMWPEPPEFVRLAQELRAGTRGTEKTKAGE